jgi:hypothetical protein
LTLPDRVFSGDGGFDEVGKAIAASASALSLDRFVKFIEDSLLFWSKEKNACNILVWVVIQKTLYAAAIEVIQIEEIKNSVA